MKSGSKIVGTDHALEELGRTFHYLEVNFTEKEITRLARKIESILGNIAKFPEMYPQSLEQRNVRRAVVAKFNTLYYRVRSDKNQIEILSFFWNRQDPEKFKH